MEAARDGAFGPTCGQGPIVATSALDARTARWPRTTACLRALPSQLWWVPVVSRTTVPRGSAVGHPRVGVFTERSDAWRSW